ncbi:MAG: hypothetical protein J0H74_22295 [Chitinophagaceae bacterium]|nr:hypothetical protein [Chitinophagaceae bacterium]
MHTTHTMVQRDAYSLLFVDEFGERPLFKNQADLVNELLRHPNSDYYTDRGDSEAYPKAVSRMKAFVSQLFSEHSRRSISQEFRRSLGIILKEKSRHQSFVVDDILEQIVDDLKERNTVRKHIFREAPKVEADKYTELAYELLNATTITIFTARDINMELQVLGRKLAIQEFFIENLVFSLQRGAMPRKFFFNFPSENLCVLFWKALKKQLASFLDFHDHVLSFVLPLIRSCARSAVSNDMGSAVSSALLTYLSKENIINVYHLSAPVYTTSVISLELPEFVSSVYLCLNTDEGQDHLHKLSLEEKFLTRLFVWDNLKIHHAGSLIKYQESY